MVNPKQHARFKTKNKNVADRSNTPLWSFLPLCLVGIQFNYSYDFLSLSTLAVMIILVIVTLRFVYTELSFAYESIWDANE